MTSRLLQMPLQTDLHNPEASVERDSISHHSLSPLTHRPSPGVFAQQLAPLQDTRYAPNYEHTSSPASANSVYSTFSSYPPSSYPTSASPYSPTVPSIVNPYTMNHDPSRPRIPAIHSPVSHHSSNPVSTSVSSVRSAYVTSTPHTSRHNHRGPKDVPSPRSPLPPTSRGLRSPTAVSPTVGTQMEAHAQTIPSGPPMGITHIIHHLYSADNVLVEPEIHGKVEKGFFMADSDWTCYRRNYFTVVCSYSLKPTTLSLPFYLKRTASSQPETVIAFAMCISAVVDGRGGKVVELVQHTPKRDKGPQHKPSKVKLAPQPPTNAGFSNSNNQQTHGSYGGDFSPFPQQSQQQYVASFERIQFKSATANNGKRRAAQQYYHLIVELYADVGNASPSGSPSSDAGWVKIAEKVSAPMVVRGRSPGHYADERRVQSPGGNSGSGNGNNNTQSPTSNGNGGRLGGVDHNTSPNGIAPEGISQFDGFHRGNLAPSNHTSPSSSIRDPSIATPPPMTHLDGHTPIDPVIVGENPNQSNYQYYPVYQPEGQQHSQFSAYEGVYPEERKSEAPLITHCLQFDNDISSYMVGKDQRLSGYNRKCGPYQDSVECSRGYFPDLPTVGIP